MISRLNHCWRRRSLAVAALAITAGLTFLVGAALPDAGNPILGTIRASVVSQTATTVTISVQGEWNWLSHNADCNYDRAGAGAGIVWGDRNGADDTRPISSIARNGNVVTVTTATQAWKVGDQVTIAGVANSSFNGGPFTVTSSSNTTVKFSQTGANATSSAGAVKDLSVFNGWLVYKSATSYGYIGTKVGTAQNPIDREVHPTDVGNVPADGKGPLPGANLSNGAPATQVVFDPGPNTTTGLGDYTKWKAGCGREPVNAAPVAITTATENASKVVTLTLGGGGNAGLAVGDSITVAGVTNTGYNGNFTATSVTGSNQVTYTSGKTGLAASSGGTLTDNTLGPNQSGQGCLEWCGDPWGSWGYQTINGYTTAFTHTYLKTLPDGSSGLPDKICVNFYDVHGGGTNASSFQAVNGASEIQVDGNNDNSISTNAFNVTDGANCTSVTVIPSSLTTNATNATLRGTDAPPPATIHDTGHLTVPPGSGGSITFTVYGPRPLSSSTADCSGSGTTLTGVPVNGSGDYDSPSFTPPAVGKYDWTAHYSGDPANSALPADSACGAANETSTVSPAGPSVTTDAGPNIVIGSGNLTDTATLSGGFNPMGSITFNLYGPNDATCATSIFTSTVPVTGNGSYQSAAYPPTKAGTYRWIANYGGDGNNNPTTNGCNGTKENVDVLKHDSTVTTHQSLIPQDNATITGNGLVTATGTVTFDLYQSSCSGSPVFEQTKTLDANAHAKTTNAGNPAPGYTAGGNGTWYWKVHYSGDGSNDPSDSNCLETFAIQEP
jgi:hypothetical protein